MARQLSYTSLIARNIAMCLFFITQMLTLAEIRDAAQTLLIQNKMLAYYGRDATGWF